MRLLRHSLAWRQLRDRSQPYVAFVLSRALRVWLSQLEDESDHVNRSPYSCGATCGVPKPTARVGLLWGAARPSDDSQAYNYNIPDNMFATVALEQAVCPCLQRSYPPACQRDDIIIIL